MRTLFGMLLVALVAIGAFAPAPAQAQNCGIYIENVWVQPEYRSIDDNGKPVWLWRDGPGVNGDDTILSIDINSLCYFDTGNIGAVAVNPDHNYDMTWVTRPRYVRFGAPSTQTVRIRLRNIFLWSNTEPDTIKYVPIWISVFSARPADILSTELVQIPWWQQYYDSGKGMPTPPAELPPAPPPPPAPPAPVID